MLSSDNKKDSKAFKNLIKQSLKNVAESEKSQNQTSLSDKLDRQAIEAYEIAFHINFEPTLVKQFCKIVAKYLCKYTNDLGKVMQLVVICSKAAITITSLRSLERLFND